MYQYNLENLSITLLFWLRITRETLGSMLLRSFSLLVTVQIFPLWNGLRFFCATYIGIVKRAPEFPWLALPPLAEQAEIK